MSRKNWSRATGFQEDSLWENKLRNGLFKSLEYHPAKIAYTVSHHYEPDWIIRNIYYPSEKLPAVVEIILIEAKGMFRDASELQKYVAIQSELEHNHTSSELVFLFQKPDAPIYFKTKRKDGTKMTHKEWAEKNNFRYFDETTIQELLND